LGTLIGGEGVPRLVGGKTRGGNAEKSELKKEKRKRRARGKKKKIGAISISGKKNAPPPRGARANLEGKPEQKKKRMITQRGADRAYTWE